MGTGRRMGQGYTRKVSGATMMIVTMMMTIRMYDLCDSHFKTENSRHFNLLERIVMMK